MILDLELLVERTMAVHTWVVLLTIFGSYQTLLFAGDANVYSRDCAL